VIYVCKQDIQSIYVIYVCKHDIPIYNRTCHPST
jgi:hypothetical protein